jgi:hypothetical protein
VRYSLVGPAFAEPGDEVSVVDPIRVGDIIQFVRVGPTEMELRHAADGPEQCYRVEQLGGEAGTIALHAVAGFGSSNGGPLPHGPGLPANGLEMDRGADLSPCDQYRYRLWRLWDRTRPAVLFIGLNPSTADAEQDDPTVRRCIGFAKEWGFGGIEVANLFAFRATDPGKLLTAADPVGPDNDAWLARLRSGSPAAVAAWGAHPLARTRANALGSSLRPLASLGVTKDGAPRHPLYVRKDTPLVVWME